MAISGSPHGAATPAENLRGALFMALAMAGYGFNDVIIKHLSSSLELGQTIFIRGLFAVFLLLILAITTGNMRAFKTALQPAIVIRSMSEVMATITFLIALFNIPIANTTAILQALPLVVTLGAALFLGEKFGWRRMIAIAIGFIGVLIIVRPGLEGFNIYSLAVLAAVIFAATRDLSTRLIVKKIPSLFIALVTAIAVTVMGGVIALFEEWKPLDLATLGWLALAAGLLVVGYSFIAAAMRVGDISFIVPFRYTILLYAIFAGVVFFDEVPDFYTLLGSAIIVATGFYTLRREHVSRINKS
ncbi:hypothetical protein MNBD_ALPHA03-1767 [hydrothermal vent metagenome]|uniref:EamA domain-containing protein n=1 Tax=hydrothermal vent metagenome TaxID=652676 RepID=A0A3B1BNA6_9ZZZZ